MFCVSPLYDARFRDGLPTHEKRPACGPAWSDGKTIDYRDAFACRSAVCISSRKEDAGR
jgi:hypothetical protein